MRFKSVLHLLKCFLLFFAIPKSITAQDVPCYVSPQQHPAFEEGKRFWVDQNGCVREESELRSATRADLSRAILTDARLSDIDLSSTMLRGASLRGADLARASLRQSDLRDADLRMANLRAANLTLANLAGSNLSDSDLTNAILRGANLQRATLVRANLEGADLRDANLFGAVYDPSSRPIIASLAQARNLDYLTYNSTPEKLRELRDTFARSGFVSASRQVNAALWRNADVGLLSTILLEFTCEFGAKPLRPLYILLFSIFLFSYIYIVAISSPGTAGLSLVVRRELNGGRVLLHRKRIAVPPGRSISSAWFTAILFSLASAFSIGFRELSLDRFIWRIQPRDYKIAAHGWLRTFSGLQALASLYLVILSVLSFLGTPLHF